MQVRATASAADRAHFADDSPATLAFRATAVLLECCSNGLVRELHRIPLGNRRLRFCDYRSIRTLDAPDKKLLVIHLEGRGGYGGYNAFEPAGALSGAGAGAVAARLCWYSPGFIRAWTGWAREWVFRRLPCLGACHGRSSPAEVPNEIRQRYHSYGRASEGTLLDWWVCST